MKPLTLCALILLSSFYLNTAFALNTQMLNEARAQLQLAVKGDEDATEKAYQLFEKLYKNNANSPLLLANLGSLETLKGRDAWMPWNKMSYVEEGLEKIDRAIEMTEDENYQDSQIDGVWQSIGVKNIAANTFISLPSMFNRFADGKEELVLMLSNSKFKQSPVSLKNSAYKLAVKVAQDENREDLVKQYQSMIAPK